MDEGKGIKVLYVIFMLTMTLSTLVGLYDRAITKKKKGEST